MSFLARLISLAGSANTLRSGLDKARMIAARVTTTVETFETASFQESLEKAERGDATAQFEIGEEYYFGRGVAQDYGEAAKWFGRAAEQGHVRAQANLGMMCALGRGVERDSIEGLKWLSLAACHANQSAVRTRVTLLKRTTPEEQAEAQLRVTDFLAKRPLRR
ncbi:MAG: sel1 repeat family protein [Verrucomicrobia bacterium]|nr:sel1 repeat family protein [Verrucomicrobiota bacterium]